METNVVTLPSGAKTSIGIVPRNNNVIVRLDFDTSLLTINALATKQKMSGATDNENIVMQVVAVGKDVKDLEIGDIVRASVQPELAVEVDGNELTIKKLHDYFTSLSRKEQDEFMISGKKIHVVEYSLYTEYQLPIILIPANK